MPNTSKRSLIQLIVYKVASTKVYLSAMIVSVKYFPYETRKDTICNLHTIVCRLVCA